MLGLSIGEASISIGVMRDGAPTYALQGGDVAVTASGTSTNK
jgi:hypothetical protein